MCIFDFAVDIPDVPASAADLHITRVVTDDEDFGVLDLDVTLDLTETEGVEMIAEGVGGCDG